MIIIIGLVILIAAVVAGVAGVLSNSGSLHALTHPFGVFGYHLAVFRDPYSPVLPAGRIRQCWASQRLSCSSSRS
jgi:disulfide bond formation protein DsbB